VESERKRDGRGGLGGKGKTRRGRVESRGEEKKRRGREAVGGVGEWTPLSSFTYLL